MNANIEEIRKFIKKSGFKIKYFLSIEIYFIELLKNIFFLTNVEKKFLFRSNVLHLIHTYTQNNFTENSQRFCL